MDRLFASKIADAVGGKIIGNENAFVDSVVTNSKDVKKNSLFVPIKGERFDAHGFINEAFKNGASISLAEKIPNEGYLGTVIKVEDSLQALQKLAEYYRLKFNIPVIGVTGSVGKTTTKEMIAYALEEKFNVKKTLENFNGQIGVPLTVFSIDKNTNVAVIEMGMNQFGEMERICKVARPNIAVINNIGISHIENLYTRENILKEKLHITDYFESNDILIVNGDNDVLSNFNFKNQKVISFGIKNNCSCMAKNVEFFEDSTEFEVQYKDINEKIILPTIGVHNVYNALAAIVVANELSVEMDLVKLGLSKYRSLSMRQQIYTFGKIDLIDDSYNASPDSMKSAIDILKLKAKDKKSIAILGDMLELGDKAVESHIEVGKYAADNNVDVLITVGELSENMNRGAKENLVIKNFSSSDDAAKFIIENLPSKCSILVKGSRGMKMDSIVKKIKDALG